MPILNSFLGAQPLKTRMNKEFLNGGGGGLKVKPPPQKPIFKKKKKK